MAAGVFSPVLFCAFLYNLGAQAHAHKTTIALAVFCLQCICAWEINLRLFAADSERNITASRHCWRRISCSQIQTVNKGNLIPSHARQHEGGESPLTAGATRNKNTWEWHLFCGERVTLWSHKFLRSRIKRPVEQRKRGRDWSTGINVITAARRYLHWDILHRGGSDIATLA